MGGDGNVGTDNIGVSATGRDDLGGIGPQLMSMVVDSKVGHISKMLLILYQAQH